jgi:KDO2-lipid IV(A) lauroyltransferase
MQAVIYYISLPFIYLISVLPFPILYLVSDLFYILMYHVIGYRRKVVMQNLKNSFPNKSDQELKKLEKQFYHYLSDLFLETFKTLTISPNNMAKHCYPTEKAIQIFKKLADENRNSIIVMGHYGNWEWGGNAFSFNCKQQLYVIYHPLANKYFNQLIINMRKRFGTDLIKMKETFKDMYSRKEELNTTAFIADQTPSAEKAYWTTFLNQDTPVFQGVEKISQKLNYPVVYISINRLDRGYYEVDAEMLFENPENTKENEILEAFTKRLEADIIKQPEIWIWSHKRWKHKRPIIQ